MGQPGRPRKTKEVKIASGTLQKCREIDHPLTFEPINGIEPPQHIDGVAREFYMHYGKILISQKLMTHADIGELEQAAMLYGELRWCYDEIKNGGGVQRTESGYTQKTASWQIFMDCRKGLSEFYNKYGLNVVSRQRIDMKPPDEPDDLDKI